MLKKYKSLRPKASANVEPIKPDPFLLVKNGDIQVMKDHFAKGMINIHETRWSGYSLLHRAAEIGHTEMCKFLVEQGIKIDIRSAKGWYTPLHLALGNGYMDTAEYFLAHGANPWLKNKYGEDPYRYGDKKGFREECQELKLRIMKKEAQNSIARMDLSKDLLFLSKGNKKNLLGNAENFEIRNGADTNGDELIVDDDENRNNLIEPPP